MSENESHNPVGKNMKKHSKANVRKINVTSLVIRNDGILYPYSTLSLNFRFPKNLCKNYDHYDL